MKLNTIRYFGRFYTYNGELGWMPLHKVAIVSLMGKSSEVDWVKQSEVKFQ